MEKLINEFGIDDQWPVFCEPFRQWVLEDQFSMGRPSFEKVGVTFTKEIEAFELMKLRILNGGHPIISYPGALLDMEYVHEPMGHQLIRDYFIKLEQQEIIPVVPPVPGTDIQNYFVQLLREKVDQSNEEEMEGELSEYARTLKNARRQKK